MAEVGLAAFKIYTQHKDGGEGEGNLVCVSAHAYAVTLPEEAAPACTEASSSIDFVLTCAQDGQAEAQVQIDALESANRKLERKLSALSAKSSALKEANAAQAVTLEGLQASHVHLL